MLRVSIRLRIYQIHSHLVLEKETVLGFGLFELLLPSVDSVVALATAEDETPFTVAVVVVDGAAVAAVAVLVTGSAPLPPPPAASVARWCWALRRRTDANSASFYTRRGG